MWRWCFRRGTCSLIIYMECVNAYNATRKGGVWRSLYKAYSKFTVNFQVSVPTFASSCIPSFAIMLNTFVTVCVIVTQGVVSVPSSIVWRLIQNMCSFCIPNFAIMLNTFVTLCVIITKGVVSVPYSVVWRLMQRYGRTCVVLAFRALL